MRNKGQFSLNQNTIAIGIAAVIALIIGFALIPSLGLPEVPGVTDEKVYVDEVEVGVRTPDYTRFELNPSVKIFDDSIVTESRNTVMSVGPFAFQSRQGTLKVRVLKDGHEISSKSKNWELSEAWYEETTGKVYTFEDLKVGAPDSGQYTLEASIYDEDGNIWDQDSATILT